MSKKVTPDAGVTDAETVTQSAADQTAGTTQDTSTTEDGASTKTFTVEAEDKVIVTDTKTMILGATCVVGVLAVTYLVGRYFGYQAALKAVAAATSQA